MTTDSEMSSYIILIAHYLHFFPIIILKFTDILLYYYHITIILPSYYHILSYYHHITILSYIHHITIITGNVTLRVDPTWGVSETLPVERTQVPKYAQSFYEYDAGRLNDSGRMSLMTPYDRCKMNRRCNWGETCKYL